MSESSFCKQCGKLIPQSKGLCTECAKTPKPAKAKNRLFFFRALIFAITCSAALGHFFSTPHKAKHADTAPVTVQSAQQRLTCGGFSAQPDHAPDLNIYIHQLQKQIRTHWHPPATAKQQTITTAFKIACSGKLLSLSILQSSGLPEADQAALQAVQAAAPFPPLPADYDHTFMPVEFSFDKTQTLPVTLPKPITSTSASPKRKAATTSAKAG